jgi:hypothetical protein
MSAARGGLHWIGCKPSLPAHLARAALMSGVVLLFADPAQGNPIARAVLAAGLMLWSFDALEQSRYAIDRAAGLRDPHRWSNAARQGAYIAAVLLIILGATPAAATGVLVGAAIFGAFWLVAPPAAGPIVQETWDSARPITQRPLWRWLYHLLPLLSLAMIAELIRMPPENSGRPVSVMFQAAFFPFILALYPSKGRFLSSNRDQMRVGGALLLGAGLWLGRE